MFELLLEAIFVDFMMKMFLIFLPNILVLKNNERYETKIITCIANLTVKILPGCITIVGQCERPCS